MNEPFGKVERYDAAHDVLESGEFVDAYIFDKLMEAYKVARHDVRFYSELCAQIPPFTLEQIDKARVEAAKQNG